MTRTKPVAAMSGRIRQICRIALDEARAHGCTTKHATVSFSGSGHPRVNVTGPDGNPLSFHIACSPKQIGNERSHMRRRLRTAIRRADESELRPSRIVHHRLKKK